MPWDSRATAHLASLTDELRAAGVIDYLRRVTGELWRSNVARHDPDGMFDDNGVLGYTASMNLANRAHRELGRPNGQLLPLAYAFDDKHSTVVKVKDIEVRFVKVPVASSRKPFFNQDFTWEEREGRSRPAARNAELVRLPLVNELSDPLFEFRKLDGYERIAECRDVFFVWAGDMSGLTSGWTGLPTLGNNTFLAVQEIWSDSGFDDVSGFETPSAPDGDKPFFELESVKPVITLKPQQDEGTNT